MIHVHHVQQKRHHRQLEAPLWTRVSADVTPVRRSIPTVYVKTVMRASIKTNRVTQESANTALIIPTTNIICMRFVALSKSVQQTELVYSQIHRQGLARAVIVLPMPIQVLEHASARLDITVCTLFNRPLGLPQIWIGVIRAQLILLKQR